MAEKHHRVEITVAVIGLIGVLGGAILANWDKLFPSKSQAFPLTAAQSASQNPEEFSRHIPKLVSPPDRSIFDHYPRYLELIWDPVPDAISYRVDVEFQPAESKDGSVIWIHHDLASTASTTNRAQIEFPGATWGRWRVTAVDQTGRESKPSDWRVFRFTQ